jgi:hypothetical protein
VKTHTWTFIDKSTWGEGPWREEPDKIQWETRAGVPCLAVRGPHGGWCGYVGVGARHPFYEKAYNVCLQASPCAEEDWCAHTLAALLEVHGGLTFSAHCREGEDVGSICHVPEPGEADNLWWLGFDCGHLQDYSPVYAARLREIYPLFPQWKTHAGYRTLTYVQAECEQLALQLNDPHLAHLRQERLYEHS